MQKEWRRYMKKEGKIIEIDYTNKDRAYINELMDFLETNCEEITDFFDNLTFAQKVKIKLWPNLEDFRCHFPWQVGVMRREKGRNYIHVLSFDEYKKTKGHEKKTLEDYNLLLLHEFVHACVKEYAHNHNMTITNKNTYLWLQEGLATKLSHQYEKHSLQLTASLEDILTNKATYNDYYTMFCYVLNAYGAAYIKSLILDFQKLKTETPKLYKEAVEANKSQYC